RAFRAVVHPAKRIHAAKSQKLAGKTIVLCVTGSIAAVETVKLARELIRHGAHVVPVLSKDATEIIHPNALHFATGREPITRLDGSVPYIELVGTEGTADLVLIAPATSNTIAKIAMGIDDTVVTTFAQNALGAKIPILIAPAMHETMYANPIVAGHLKTLEKHGVEFVTPKFEEEKAKLADVDEIVARAIRLLGGGELAGKRVVVIAGATAEPIDDIRIVTNRSSGETGIELAKAAFEMGADLELWLGRHHTSVPLFLTAKHFETTADLAAMAKTMRADVCVVPAAISDFSPTAAKGKISSRKGNVNLELRPTPKVLPALRKGAKVLVGFKAESRVSEAELRRRAMDLLKEAKLDVVVANDVGNVSRGATTIVILDRKGRARTFKGRKAEAAEAIWKAVLDGEGK
ncbi:MAG TPA: bifunctional phosphopantothenoylcysteine decarboxylase/phosphopantothenate--cysteine ligase CoaBC, partial [Thermoplasmata archaeon]|nr:bifunctional phosphopantothenoylcysteine decarboxylase/phosphopantothenate--cysteine ligase CoaBC [Thermoplasmata archaeon]